MSAAAKLANSDLSEIGPHPTQNRWPIEFDNEGARNGILISLAFALFTGLVGFIAFVFYLLKGRHAKDNWKNKLDVEDDIEEEERRGRGVRVTSLKRKDREGPEPEKPCHDEEAAIGT